MQAKKIELMLRKLVAQIGVLLFIASMLEGIFLPFIVYSSGWLSIISIALFYSGILVLLIASVLPASERDEWGSMWPLVGYDNAIDAIYTRGPWWVKFAELEGQDSEQRVVDGMSRLFGTS